MYWSQPNPNGFHSFHVLQYSESAAAAIFVIFNLSLLKWENCQPNDIYLSFFHCSKLRFWIWAEIKNEAHRKKDERSVEKLKTATTTTARLQRSAETPSLVVARVCVCVCVCEPFDRVKHSSQTCWQRILLLFATVAGFCSGRMQNLVWFVTVMQRPIHIYLCVVCGPMCSHRIIFVAVGISSLFNSGWKFRY